MKVEIKQRPVESEGQPCLLCDEGCTFYEKLQCDEVTICKLGAGVSTMVSEGMKPGHCCPGAGFYELTPESRAEVYVRVKAEEWERVQGENARLRERLETVHRNHRTQMDKVDDWERIAVAATAERDRIRDENANLKAGNKKLGEELHTASVIEAEQEEELGKLSAENTYLKEANFDRLVPPLNDALQKLEAENASLNTELADYKTTAEYLKAELDRRNCQPETSDKEPKLRHTWTCPQCRRQHIYRAIKGQPKSVSCDCWGGFAGTTGPAQGEGEEE